MSHEVYYHFPQADGQARRAGARGGKAAARHRRERLNNLAAEGAEPPACPDPPFALETTAAAIALLDARYPWLRGTERRSLRSPGSAARV
jgi:hypothetical protein